MAYMASTRHVRAADHKGARQAQREGTIVRRVSRHQVREPSQRQGRGSFKAELLGARSERVDGSARLRGESRRSDVDAAVRGRTVGLMRPDRTTRPRLLLPKPPRPSVILQLMFGGIGTERLAPSGTLVLRQRHAMRRSHVQRQPVFQRFRLAILARYRRCGVLGAPAGVMAQALTDVKTPDKPLVLKAQGSFFVGGEKVEQTAGELGDLGPGGHITVNQMYVRYMVPQAWRRQRTGGDGARRDPDRKVVGDDAGRPDGMGRVFRSQRPSRLRSRSGGARPIRIQSGRLNDVRAGSKPPTELPIMAAVQRRRRLAELPLRRDGRRSRSPTASSP